MSSYPHRTIRLYHGFVPTHVREVLNNIASLQEGSESWFFDGSLEELAERLKGIAMFFVTSDNETIYVTHYITWSTC